MPIIVQFNITMDDQGVVNVNSNAIANKMLCYGLLDVARDVVHDESEKAAKQLIHAAPPGAVEFLSSRK